MLAILAESALRSLILGSVVWIGLNLLRVRNPNLHMTCWTMVLVASLSMPLLMHWTTVTVTVDALPAPAAEHLWSAKNPLTDISPELLGSLLAPETGMPAAAPGEHAATVNWLALATAIYAFVAGMLLLRLAVGLYLTWRLARAAKPMSEPWTADWSVRVSNVIAGPVTFGSTILLPPQCFDWDLRKREAVLAHEGAHVVNRDFYLLLFASFNRAVFWFSPFAWWHLTRLAELAEIISDARALEVVAGQAVLRRDSARSGPARPAGAGGDRNGKSLHGALPRGAHSRRNRGPREIELEKANWHCRGHPAGGHRFCRLDRLPHSPAAVAGDRPRGRCVHRGAQAAIGFVLFIGPNVDLHRFSRRRRFLRAAQRAAKAPVGRGR